MFDERMDGSFDEIGNIVNDLQLNARRQLRAQLLHLRSHVVGYAHGVYARLPQHLNGDDVLGRRVLSEQRGPRAQLLRAIFHLGYVSHAHRGASARADHDFAELFRRRHAPQRAQPQLLRPGNHAAAWRFYIFSLQRITDVQNRKMVRSESLRIEQNANLPHLPAV